MGQNCVAVPRPVLVTVGKRGVACRCFRANRAVCTADRRQLSPSVDNCCRGVLSNVSSGPPRDPCDHGRFFCEELQQGGGALHDRGLRPFPRAAGPTGVRVKAVRTTVAKNATTAKVAEATRSHVSETSTTATPRSGTQPDKTPARRARGTGAGAKAAAGRSTRSTGKPTSSRTRPRPRAHRGRRPGPGAGRHRLDRRGARRGARRPGAGDRDRGGPTTTARWPS